MPVVPGEGWGVLHLFFHVQRGLLEDGEAAAKDWAARLAAFDAGPDQQVLAFTVLGQKADLGLMVLGPDLEALDAFTAELAASPLGLALAPAGSYVSLTEVSEYAADASTEYREHKLHPRLPAKPVLCFYPMTKRRDGEDNWYVLPFDERKQLMAGHGRLGRTFSGRILQLITTSAGLDDWEWGVTLLADDPADVNRIVYQMRFDAVSARYAEFGPFVLGLVCPPEELGSRLRLA